MLKNTKSDMGNKRASGTVQSDGFLADAAHKEEQNHKWHKGRVGASMKVDNNGDYDTEKFGFAKVL